MAKLGRYSADRKKVATLTNAATTTGKVSDCGTVFIATGASGTTVYNLPSVATAGKGWWIKVVKVGAADAGGTIRIEAHADDGNTPTVGIYSADVNTAITKDRLDIIDGADPGTQLEILCDGERFIVLGHTAVDADLTEA